MLRRGDFRERFIAANNLPLGGSAAEFVRMISVDAERNLAVIRAAGIRVE